MKILSVRLHSPVQVDGNLTTHLHHKDVDVAFKDNWILVTSKRSGKMVAIPAANIPFMDIEPEEKVKAKKGE